MRAADVRWTSQIPNTTVWGGSGLEEGARSVAGLRHATTYAAAGPLGERSPYVLLYALTLACTRAGKGEWAGPLLRRCGAWAQQC